MDDENFETPELHIKLEEAQKIDPNYQIGEFVEEALESIDFGRIGAQAAKQVIFQKIRDAEREQILSDFMERSEHLVSGTVKRVERGMRSSNSARSSLAAARSDDTERKFACGRSCPRLFAAC